MRQEMEREAEEPTLSLDPEPAPDDTVALAQRDEAVRRAVAELPPEQAELVRIAFFEDRSHSEIAAATGLPLGTVKSRLRLAFGRLRKALESAEQS